MTPRRIIVYGWKNKIFLDIFSGGRRYFAERRGQFCPATASISPSGGSGDFPERLGRFCPAAAGILPSDWGDFARRQRGIFPSDRSDLHEWRRQFRSTLAGISPCGGSDFARVGGDFAKPHGDFAWR